MCVSSWSIIINITTGTARPKSTQISCHDKNWSDEMMFVSTPNNVGHHIPEVVSYREELLMTVVKY